MRRGRLRWRWPRRERARAHAVTACAPPRHPILGWSSTRLPAQSTPFCRCLATARTAPALCGCSPCLAWSRRRQDLQALPLRAALVARLRAASGCVTLLSAARPAIRTALRACRVRKQRTGQLQHSAARALCTRRRLQTALYSRSPDQTESGTAPEADALLVHVKVQNALLRRALCTCAVQSGQGLAACCCESPL